MKVKIKRLTETAKLPTRGSDKAAGYDLYADIGESVAIPPGETYKFNTGIAFTAPEGYFGAIFARSGLSIKRGMRPANCVGVVDEDFVNEVIVALHNDSKELVVIEPQERIAQVVFLPYLDIEFQVVNELKESNRKGGFGSTGRF